MCIIHKSDSNWHTCYFEYHRLGKFTWRECLDDECFDVEKLVTLSKEPEATDTQETQPSSSLRIPSSSTYFLEVPPPSKPQPMARSLKYYFFDTE